MKKKWVLIPVPPKFSSVFSCLQNTNANHTFNTLKPIPVNACYQPMKHRKSSSCVVFFDSRPSSTQPKTQKTNITHHADAFLLFLHHEKDLYQLLCTVSCAYDFGSKKEHSIHTMSTQWFKWNKKTRTCMYICRKNGGERVS